MDQQPQYKLMDLSTTFKVVDLASVPSSEEDGKLLQAWAEGLRKRLLDHVNREMIRKSPCPRCGLEHRTLAGRIFCETMSRP
jgi:hypothetical protein